MIISSKFEYLNLPFEIQRECEAYMDIKTMIRLSRSCKTLSIIIPEYHKKRISVVKNNLFKYKIHLLNLTNIDKRVYDLLKCPVNKYDKLQSMTWNELRALYFREKFPYIRKGDVIYNCSLKDNCDNNNRILFFDGNKLINTSYFYQVILDKSNIIFCNIPEQFIVPDFPIEYWLKDNSDIIPYIFGHIINVSSKIFDFQELEKNCRLYDHYIISNFHYDNIKYGLLITNYEHLLIDLLTHLDNELFRRIFFKVKIFKAFICKRNGFNYMRGTKLIEWFIRFDPRFQEVSFLFWEDIFTYFETDIETILIISLKELSIDLNF